MGHRLNSDIDFIRDAIDSLGTGGNHSYTNEGAIDPEGTAE
jgi:hypothetical protein